MTDTFGPAMISPVLAEAASEAPEFRRVAFDAPWNWLGAGWRDLWSAFAKAPFELIPGPIAMPLAPFYGA